MSAFLQWSHLYLMKIMEWFACLYLALDVWNSYPTCFSLFFSLLNGRWVAFGTGTDVHSQTGLTVAEQVSANKSQRLNMKRGNCCVPNKGLMAVFVHFQSWDQEKKTFVYVFLNEWLWWWRRLSFGYCCFWFHIHHSEYCSGIVLLQCKHITKTICFFSISK